MNRDDKPEIDRVGRDKPSGGPAVPVAKTAGETDQSLLFGIVALQMNFITREGLVSSMKAWVLSKQRSLSAILIETGLMLPAHCQMLEPLVAAYIQQYDNDPQRCLAALSSISAIKEELDRIQDPELTVILHRVAESLSSNPVPEGTSQRATKGPGPEIRFRILRPHAKGGLGQVSVALDKELNREVALKEIQKKHLSDSASRERFILEAEITGGLQHPGIVPVYGLGQFPDGSPFYAMRFIRGDSLKEAIKEYHQADRQPRRSPTDRRLEMRKLLGRFIDVCNAMEYAHSRGVLHRDLKPGNIMLGKYGETLVVDWGLAKALGQNEIDSEEQTLIPSSTMSSTGKTQAGSALGTPAYMSPEQAAGKLDELGPETDVYSLGATMYHLLTGRAPFAGKPLDVLKLVKAGEFVRPSQVDAETPPALEAICLKAMSLKPQQRYSSPRLMAEDLERWLADEPVHAHSETWSERLTRLERKHRSWVRAGTASMAVIAVLAVVAALWINVERAKSDKLAIAESTAKTNAQNEKVLAEAATADAIEAKSLANSERARADANAKDAIRRADELQVQLAKTHFQHGLAEYESGQANLGVKDLVNAWRLLPKSHELHAAYEQVLVDRMMRGGKAIPCVGGTFSPDGSHVLSFLFKDKKMSRQIYDVETLRPIGAPLINAIDVHDIFGGYNFSENNERLVAFGGSNIGRVWEVKTGRLTGQLVGHETACISLAVSPDGTRAVSGSRDRTARLWDLQNHTQLGQAMRHHEGSIAHPRGYVDFVAFSPDGLRIATGSDDSVRLWDGKTGASVGESMSHRRKVMCIAFSRDSRRLVTGSADNMANVWDVSTGRPVSGPIIHESPVQSVAFSPDGLSVVTIAGGTARMWNSRTAARIGDSMSNANPEVSAEFSPDGTRVVTNTVEGTIQLWDARNGRSFAEPMYSASGDIRPVFLPDGIRLFSGRHCWESFANLPIAGPVATDDFAMDVKFSPDGRRVLAAVGKSIRVWDSVTFASLGELVRDELNIDCFAISTDGKRLVTGPMANTKENPTTRVRLWNAETGVPLGTSMDHPQHVLDVTFSADGTQVATGCMDGSARLWDGVTGAFVWGPFDDDSNKQGKVTFGKVGVAFSPDGRRLAVATRGNVGVWDIHTRKLERELVTDQSSNSTESVVFSPDGLRLVTTSLDRTAHLWDTRNGNVIGESMHHATLGGFPESAFSPDGSVVVTSADGQSARFWDAWTGVPLREPLRHPGITSLAFSPDGTRLVTCGSDKMLRIWDTSPLPRPKDLPGWISSFSGVNVLDPGPATSQSTSPPQEHVSIFQREAEWYAAVRQRQSRNCRQFQFSAAREAESLKDWLAAEFHLQHLLQAEPDNTELKSRLQAAREQLKK